MLVRAKGDAILTSSLHTSWSQTTTADPTNSRLHLILECGTSLADRFLKHLNVVDWLTRLVRLRHLVVIILDTRLLGHFLRVRAIANLLFLLNLLLLAFLNAILHGNEL